MKVAALNGSPRAQNGFTDIVVRRFLAGAEEAGAETEVFYPARMKIAPCIGCLHCWFKTPGVCRHKDDLPALVESLAECDVVVFASPVYVDGMTGQMKVMFDRMVASVQPFFEFVDTRTYHPHQGKDIRGRKVVAVSVCGFQEREHFQAISLHFRRICENMRAEFLGEFDFPGSSVLASDPELVESNLAAVGRAGKEVVEKGRISRSTLEEGNREYIDDPAAFGEAMNETFHNLRRQYKAE